MTRRGCRSRPPSPSSLRSPSRALPNSAGSAPAAAPREQRPNRTRPSVPASQVGRPRLVNRIHPHEAEIKGATMPAHHHRRRTALVPALTAVAGLVALALAGPAYATYPGHNGRIAFQSATAQGIQIFTVRPDGRRLAFMGFNDEPFGQALLTSDIDGSNPLQLTPFSFNVGFKLDWAPDGRQLAFIHNADFAFPNDSANIATIRPDGTGLRFLTNYHGGQVNAFVGTYSPDGRWIAFRLEDHGQFGLYKMHPDGTHLRPILGLSSFRPSFIDWGANARPGDDEPGGHEDNGDRQDDDSHR